MEEVSPGKKEKSLDIFRFLVIQNCEFGERHSETFIPGIPCFEYAIGLVNGN